MHRIDTPTATEAGTFTEGSAQGGIPATQFSADWCNAIQAELAAVIEGNDIELVKSNNGQLFAAISAMLLGRQQFTNEFINGDFDLWQRGFAFSVVDAQIYGPDRFFLGADASGGTGEATVSRQTFSLAQTDVPGNPRHYCRWLQTVVANLGTPRLGQRIESMRTFFNTPMRVSFWARCDTTLLATLRIDRNFGSGGSTPDTVFSETFTLTGTWQRFEFEVALPQNEGEVLGPASYLQIHIDFPTLATFSADVADWLVQRGTFVNPYPRVPLGVEQLRAGRYFEKSYAIDIAPGTAGFLGAATMRGNANPTAYGINQRFRAEKRDTPTVTWYSPEDGAAGEVSVDAVSHPIDTQFLVSTAATGYFDLDTGGGTDKVVVAHWTADAELY